MYKKYFQNYLSSNPEGYNFSEFDSLDLPDFALENNVIDLNKTFSFFHAQDLVAQILNVTLKSHIQFFENSSEALISVLKKYQHKSKLKILTSDSEFFDLIKFKGNIDLDIIKISTMPFDNFNERLIEIINRNQFDIIYLSSVFYNSGMTLQNLNEIFNYIDFEKTQFILDGNRSFLQIPTDLSQIENQITYFASAQNIIGTEICIYFSSETNHSFDLPHSLNHLIKTLELFSEQKIQIKEMHSYIQSIQKKFREQLLASDHFYLAEKNILSVDYNKHGWFYAFVLPSNEVVDRIVAYLHAHQIKTDKIESRLIVHFKLYQDNYFDLKFLKEHRKI